MKGVCAVFLRAGDVQKALDYLAQRFTVLRATPQHDGKIAVICRRGERVWKGKVEPNGDIYHWKLA